MRKNSIKKGLVKMLAAMMMMGSLSVNTFADESVNVYVTISDDKGKLALVQEKISVTDIDGDNALTINDALYCAHEAKYEGGANAGYAVGESQFGISLNKLWGVANGGSYGYYVNNQSAWSLTDAVNENDYVKAFVYTDLTAWSDTYSFFDINSKEIKESETIELTLMAAGYDANFNPVTLPVSDAIITLNGEETEFKTDSEGKVTVKIDKAGYYVISAISATQNIVPPVCKVEVLVDENKKTDDNTTNGENTTSKENATTEESTIIEESTKSENETTTLKENVTTTTKTTSPDTSDNFGGHGMVILLVASMTLITFISFKKKSIEN